MTTLPDATRKRISPRSAVTIAVAILLIVSLGFNLALFFAGPSTTLGPKVAASPPEPGTEDRKGDEQLAYLLVKLELQTRSEMAGHFTRAQSSLPGVDKLYQRLLAKNLILPAAVAGNIFSEVVPQATSGRAWVKMVVDQPRNPKNRGDEEALNLLAELRKGAATAERDTGDAFYYAEPIKAKAGCMYCHGEPKGAPDPFFPQYTKDGWRAGDIIGAVIARVAPEEAVGG